MLVSAVVVLLYGTLGFLSLSSEQKLERDFGRFDGLTFVDSMLPDGLRPGPEPELSARLALLTASPVELSDSITAIWSPDLSARVGTEEIAPYYLEIPWGLEPFDQRYRLDSGRWPSAVGEIALINSSEAQIGESVTARGRLDALTIVGTASDRYTDQVAIAAPPGTWATFSPAISTEYGEVYGGATLYWMASDPAGVVVRMDEQLGREYAQPVLASENTVLASEVMSDGSWTAKLPLAYQVPALLFPLLSVAVLHGVSRRRLRTSIRALQDLGMSPGSSSATVALASLISVVAMSILGVALGVLLYTCARPIVDHFRTVPVGPPGNPLRPSVLVLAATVVGGVVHGCALAVDSNRPVVRRRGGGSAARAQLLRTARRASAVGLGCVAVYASAFVEGPVGAMYWSALFALIVLTLIPDVVNFLIARIPESSTSSLLVKRRLELEPSHAVQATAALSVLWGLPIAFLVLLQSGVATQTLKEARTELLSNDVMLAGESGVIEAPADRVLDVAGPLLRGEASSVVRVGHMYNSDGLAQPSGSLSSIMIFESVDDLDSALMATLSEEQRADVEAGALVVWEGSDAGRTIDWYSSEGVLAESIPIDTVRIDIDRVGLATFQVAAMTANGARMLGLPFTWGAYIFRGVSAATASDAVNALRRSGLPESQLSRYEQADVVAPSAWRLAAAIFVAFTCGIGLLVSISIRRAMAQNVQVLASLGASENLTSRVVAGHIAVPAATGLIASLVIGVMPAVVAAARVSQFSLDVPWQLLGMLGASMISMMFATFALSALGGRSRSSAGVR